MLGKWKKISSECVCENPFWKYVVDGFKTQSGVEGKYYYMDTGDSVCIVPVDADGKVILVKQYRYLFDKISLEFPGGGIEKDQNPQEAAEHELAQEAGFCASSLKLISQNASNAGLIKETQYVFFATGLENDTSDQAGNIDKTEEFEIIRLTPEEVEEKIKTGEIFNNFALGAWCVCRHLIHKTQ
ncbi:MAG: NUDIX hydrolase [Patescibacteria group bacterium]